MKSFHRQFRLIMCMAILSLFEMTGFPAVAQADQPSGPSFEIKEFLLEGNAIFHDDLLLKILAPFTGPDKRADDVEKARSALEQYYHERGYPTVLVNIPEQTVESGTVRLEVIESKVRRVRVQGNRYFTRETLLKEMPAFRPGEVLYLPRIREQLARMNRNPDLKVAPVLMPGKKTGTVDVEFRVKDKLPLHGSLEYNNRSTHTTTDTRLNAMLRYDNLWQKEHSAVLQYQTAPEDTDEVQLLTFSYGLPSPLNDEHMIAAYAVWSDSDTATADDINVVGKGYILGVRYMVPLPSSESYIQDVIIGLDYKDFEDRIADAITTPVQYLPVSAVYTGVLPDSGGQTRFSLGLNFNLRRFSSEVETFEDKRAYSHGNYLYASADLQRDQKLPLGMRLFLQADGRLASQALISNEQYIAGGVESVRGYKENEVSGDDAWHWTAELQGPDMGHVLGADRWIECVPYAFYDGAGVHVRDALEGEQVSTTLSGAGVGVRGFFLKHFEYQIDWAAALEETQDTQSGENRFYFKVKFKF
jgi:hemolysin activation/secretion protein